MKSTFIIIFCLSFLGGCNEAVKEDKSSEQWNFHTTPDKWKEPRIFQIPSDNQWADRISISTEPLRQLKGEKIFSPNKAYWFVAEQLDPMKPGPYNFTVNIYNERDYIIKLNFLDIYGNFERQANWINEKLIYSRVWFGRVLGIDLIYDVEKELVIYKELVNYGGNAFLQWQQVKQK